MTVEELIEELKLLPPTAIVFVQSLDDDDDYVDDGVDEVVYQYGRVFVRFTKSEDDE